MIFTWNEAGTLMTKLQDMMDSAGFQRMMGLIAAWQARQGKA